MLLFFVLATRNALLTSFFLTFNSKVLFINDNSALKKEPFQNLISINSYRYINKRLTSMNRMLLRQARKESKILKYGFSGYTSVKFE